MGTYVEVGTVRHLPGLPHDVGLVPTVGFRRTQHVITQAVAHNEIVVVSGAAGLGKTFAVAEAVAGAPVPSVWIQIGPATTPKEVTARLSRAVFGSFPRGVLYEMTDDLVAALVDDRRVVVVDEAQNLNKKGMDQVRLLHDLSLARFPLVFVGGFRCAEVLASDPQLEDRVSAWVRFEPFTGKDLFAALDAYHPLFAATERRVLAAVDDMYAHGVFRRWALFLKNAVTAVAASEDRDTISGDVAARVLATLRRTGP